LGNANAVNRADLFDQVPCGIVLLDRDLVIVDHNRAFTELHGEGIGRHCYTVCHARQSTCPDCVAQACLKDGCERSLEQTIRSRDGRRRYLLIQYRPLPDETGQLFQVAAIITDITERRRAEEDYRILFEQVPCYVSVLDADLKVIRTNDLYRRAFGEPAGRACFVVIKHRSDRCEVCPARRTLADGRVHTCDQVGTDRSGSPTHLIVSTAPLRRKAGRVTRIIKIGLDVTELRRLEAEQRDAERLAAVGQTVAGLAHAIKNILAGMEGGMYMARVGLRQNDADGIEQGWGMVERNVGRIGRLARDLLNFARDDELLLREVDPAALVRDAATLYVDLAEQFDCTVLTDIAPGVADAPLDPVGIHDALANLVANAIHACADVPADRRRVVLRLREEGTTLVFEVEDTGSGMTPDVKQRAFDAFFTTKGPRGTGVGLMAVRRVVERHGGTIGLTTQVGEGSTFRLALAREELAARRDAISDTESRQGG